MNSMKDFLGKELSIGDSVVFIVKGYRAYDTGKIISFNEHQVKVKYFYCANENCQTEVRTIHQDPWQLIKLEVK